MPLRSLQMALDQLPLGILADDLALDTVQEATRL
jgi:hypothetical protein